MGKDAAQNFSPVGQKKRYWIDHSSNDIAALKLDEVIAVLPLGATEQHGPHLPLSVDSCIINGMVDRLIPALPENSPVLFLPIQSVTKSVEHLDFPGTLALSHETVMRVWIEIGLCVAQSGVRKLVLFNAHGGNIPAMDVVARELRKQANMAVFCVNWFGVGMPEGVYSAREQKFGIHAGDMETSAMLALDPQNVDMTQAQDFKSQAEDFGQNYPGIDLSGPAKPGWLMQDMNAQGACGEAHLASADKGNRTLDFAVGKLVDVFAAIQAFPAPAQDDSTDQGQNNG